ncbi:hypothetical protein, partial [Faecalimonas umbilicata]|uniref:hypothetical protein n=1 Tax=Faecalimonas umbilicata TaxID=1912855 RepID=UPI0039923318
EIPAVTPFVGVWIEILFYPFSYLPRPSLPSWECGLKSTSLEAMGKAFKSLPSWECGLKFMVVERAISSKSVTPFAGVWIEIQNMKLEHRQKISLSS